MTISAEVKQTLASLHGAVSSLDAMGAATVDETTRELLLRSAKRLHRAESLLEARVRQLEFEEPEYKGL
ncbi:MAG: hypothetical protein ACM3QZ_10870 [Solirubrobacterales bacterium]